MERSSNLLLPPTLIMRPGFSWDKVNFHKKLVGLTQTSQSNGIFCGMWWHAQYLSGELTEARGFCYSGASWALGGDNISCCIFFLSELLLLFSPPFAVLVNCFYHNPWVLPFPSDSSLHPTGTGEERESNCVVLCCQLRLNHNIMSDY